MVSNLGTQLVMKKIFIFLFVVLISLSSTAQINKYFKFSTFYGAVNGSTSISDQDIYSVSNGLETEIVATPYDYNIVFGIRKIARFGYENKANTFYDGTETSYSDAATIGKISGLEFLFEIDFQRQEGVDYLNQNHFIRYVADRYILKGEYLQDGFADINYFETSERFRYKLNNKLSVNIGASQRLSEPYGYNPLDEWLLSNGSLHYTYLAIQEGYSIDVYNNEYKNPSGETVANSVEVWEEVVIPQVLADYVERKRNELENKMQQSLVIGFDYYHYTKNFWMHSWANILPWHYDDGGSFSYHNYNDKKQWYDFSGGTIFGYKLNKNFGIFVEGKYSKYWNRRWYDFKFGANYVIF